MDQFQDKAKKGLEFIRDRANEAMEAQKLTSKVRQLESRRDECILDLGHRVFVMFEMDRFDPDSLKDRVEEIREINHELEQTMQDARQVKEQFKANVGDVLPGQKRYPEAPDYNTSSEPEAEPAGGGTATTVMEEEPAPTATTDDEKAPAATTVLKEDGEAKEEEDQEDS